MSELLVAGWLALWLGLLTAVSPCPLATNIAAVAYLSRRIDHLYVPVLAGVLYASGRMLAYVLVGGVISASLLSAPVVSAWLQQGMTQLMGPTLIVVGMLLTGLLTLPVREPTGSDDNNSASRGPGLMARLTQLTERMGLAGAALLGFVFALTFCPTSAALFLGSLLPLAVASQSWVLIPSIYGLGTALPVLVFAVAMVAGARWLGRSFEITQRLEPVMRIATGSVMIAAGIYLSFVYILLV